MNSEKFPVNTEKGREEAIQYAGNEFAGICALSGPDSLRFRLLFLRGQLFALADHPDSPEITGEQENVRHEPSCRIGQTSAGKG